MENYIPANDTIEELIGEELTDEKKAELDEMRNSPAYPDEMFEEAEKQDALKNYKEAFGYLNNTEKNKFQKILPQKTKDAYNLIAEYCMKEYNEKYGEISEDEYWRYMIADYSATGEGNTVCLMVTQAVPYGDDLPPSGSGKYGAITTQEYRAVREFHQKFGSWYLQGIRFLPREEFFMTCAYYIPPVMMKLANANCYKDFYTKVHYNFS